MLDPPGDYSLAEQNNMDSSSSSFENTHDKYAKPMIHEERRVQKKTSTVVGSGGGGGGGGGGRRPVPVALTSTGTATSTSGTSDASPYAPPPPPPTGLYRSRSPRQSRSRSVRRSRSNGGRARRYSKSSTSAIIYRVLLSTPSRYDKWTTLILSVPPLLVLSQIITLAIADTKLADLQRSATAWSLGWAMIFIVFVYMLVLPKQIDIRSNGTISIKTFLITYQFDDICHAYQAEFGRETMMGARYRFATCLNTQVVLRRRHGKFDVMISPDEPEEFLKILQSVITKLEIERNQEREATTDDDNDEDYETYDDNRLTNSKMLPV